MKKFNEILSDIQQARADIKSADKRIDELVEGYKSMTDLESKIMQHKKVNAELCKLNERVTDKKLYIKIAENNAKIALFNEVMPVALEILAKYSGKPYGEKTRQKISDEVKEKTNCRFYIDSRYGSYSFNVYPADAYINGYDIECGTEYTNGIKKPLLVDNKIQVVAFDEIGLYYVSRDYVDDIPSRIAELKQIYADAVEKQKELETICNRFNTLAVGDIPRIYKDKNIYNNIQI